MVWSGWPEHDYASGHPDGPTVRRLGEEESMSYKDAATLFRCSYGAIDRVRQSLGQCIF
jgi:hypothetical protein